jgi:hypothetical protein
LSAGVVVCFFFFFGRPPRASSPVDGWSRFHVGAWIRDASLHRDEAWLPCRGGRCLSFRSFRLAGTGATPGKHDHQTTSGRGVTSPKKKKICPPTMPLGDTQTVKQSLSMLDSSSTERKMSISRRKGRRHSPCGSSYSPLPPSPLPPPSPSPFQVLEPG